MKASLSAVDAFAVAATVLCPSARAEDTSDLAQDLTNPVADLLTIPFQLNYDQNFGRVDGGWRFHVQANFVLAKP